jgi:hypothetical protein
VDPREAFPPGAREYLRLLRTLPASEAPDPDGGDAARAVTRVLRDRLRRELGEPRSYGVLERLLAYPGRGDGRPDRPGHPEPHAGRLRLGY